MTQTADVLAGRYRLDGIVGRGGMSDVYRALDLRGGRHVAVKIVRTGDPEFAHRLAREARTLERIRHPGLLRLLATGTVDGQAFIVTELAEGHDLARRLRDGPLTPAATADLGGTLAGALAYIHARGIVHRDVKPANVLFGADGGARLADFGIARLIDASTHTVAGTTLGTTAYMAPEQLEGDQVGPGADVWSLGIVLLECLDGERVYGGTHAEIIARRLSGPVPVPGDLPVPWALLLGGMLDPRPERRPTGDDVASRLAGAAFRAPWERAADDAARLPTVVGWAAPGSAPTRLQGGEPPAPGDTRVAPPGVAATGPVTPARRRWPLVVAGLVALALVAGSLAAIAGGRKPNRQAAAATATTRTVPPTTTTTTTRPHHDDDDGAVGPGALTALTSAITAGEADGSVGPSAGSALAALAGRAFADQAAGDTAGATRALTQAVDALGADVRDGTVTATEAGVLQADLGQLATALGLVAPAAPSTTPATAAPTPATVPAPAARRVRATATATASTAEAGRRGGAGDDETAPSVVVPTSPHRPPGGAEQHEDQADHEDQDPERPEDGDLGDEADEQQYDTDDDHVAFPVLSDGDRRVPVSGGPKPAQWPRRSHSGRSGASAPMVVGSPWPGSTRVAPGSVNRRSRIEAMMVGKLEKLRPVAPGPPWNSVSPENTTPPSGVVEADPARASGPGCGSPSSRCSPTGSRSPSARRGRARGRGRPRPTARGRRDAARPGRRARRPAPRPR